MRNYYTVLLLLFLVSGAFAQENPDKNEEPRTVVVEGESTVEWNMELENKKQVRSRALQRAKIDALEKAFGQIVISGNSTYVKNVQTGEQAETQTVFNMLGETSVKGEIIELQKEDYNFTSREERVGSKKKTFHYVECKIKALAREISPQSIEFSAFPLSGDTKNNRTEHLYKGDDIYFYFKSPSSGYVSIYVDISGTGVTERILPYQYVPRDFENGMPVKADQEYIFFSAGNKHDYYPERAVQVDEIQAFPEEQNEHWRFFVVFSKNPINKPMLRQPDPEKEDGKIQWELPKRLNSEDFQRWKIKQQTMRSDMQVKVLDVNVTKE